MMTLPNKGLVKIRVKYAIVFLLLLVIEVLIALYVHDQLIRPYIGDVLVVVVLYLGIRILLPEGVKLLPLYLFIFAALVELLQLFKVLQLFHIENNTFLRIVFGSVFDIKDIICYGIGCLCLGIYEWKMK
jgi:hypothetical protein